MSSSASLTGTVWVREWTWHNEARTGGHKHMYGSLIFGSVCACTHAHIGVFSQQSELLPSDDTACEDDVWDVGTVRGTHDYQAQTAQMGQPRPALLPPKFAETGFPPTSDPTGRIAVLPRPRLPCPHCRLLACWQLGRQRVDAEIPNRGLLVHYHSTPPGD